MNGTTFGVNRYASRTPTEARGARARQNIILRAAGCGPIGYDVRNGRAYDEGGGKDFDIQVQIERTVMVDHESRAPRKQRAHWEGKRGNITNGDTSSTDQGQWELSSVTKTADAVLL